jgi:AraC family transcriptional regulator, transcriptional activator of pobA
MKKSIGSEAIPIINTTQLESELLFKGGIPVSTLTANAHEHFHINRVEDYFRMIDFPLPSDLQPRRMTVYNFIFLTKGQSTRSRGIDTYEFGENTFFFVPAHQITTHKFIRQDVEGFYCHFSLELLNNDTKRNLINEFPFLEFNNYPLVKISNEALKYVLPILERLLVEYKADKNCRMDILKTYLITLFTELKPFAENQISNSSNAGSQITEQFKKALSIHIYEKNKITDYAELLSISPNHLNKSVKKTLGKSAHDLLNEMLLLEAKVLLKQTNLNISEIAFKIGQNEISSFGRFFKAQTGMSPSEYRTIVPNV